LHQVGDLFELNVKLRCQKVKYSQNCGCLDCRLLHTVYRHSKAEWLQ